MVMPAIRPFACILFVALLATAGCDPDTTPPPFPLALGLPPAAHKVSVMRGSSGPSDSVAVVIVGDRSTRTSWGASRKKGWTNLLAARGMGNGMVRWARNTSNLGLGTWVDTIIVTVPGAAGSPWRVLDSVVVIAPPSTGLRIPSDILKRCVR